MRDLVNQLRLLLKIFNALQLRLERLHGNSFNLAFIHATGPEVADLLLHGCAALLLGGAASKAWRITVSFHLSRGPATPHAAWSGGMGLAAKNLLHEYW